MNVLARTALLLLCLFTGSAYALPPQFTASYTLSSGNLELGETRRTLRAEGNGSLLFESTTVPKGFLSLVLHQQLLERSRLQHQAGRFRSLEYLYLRSGGDNAKRTHISFDWTRHTAQVVSNDRPRELVIPEGTLDPLGFQIALMQDLEQGKTEFTYPIADRRKIKTYDIRVIGEEQVNTPAGAFRTFKLKQLNQSGERDLSVWCAPALDYLPVQIEYREKDGRLYRSTLKSVQGIEAGPK
jgi:hypothetical protein